MSVTAVVLSYWPKRLPNLRTIVTDLFTGTLPPDKAIVVLQGHTAMSSVREMAQFDDWWFDGRVEVIRTAANFHTRAKFVAALLELADWYLLMDDDTSVGYRTLDHLVHYPKASMTDDLLTEDWVTGYWGVTLSPEGNFMAGGAIHQPLHLREPMPVDGFHGRAIFANHAALTRMFRVELSLRKDEVGDMAFPHEGDDIIIGLDGNAWLIPMPGDTWFKDLDEHGQALQYNTEAQEGEEHYFEMRDRFTHHVLGRLGR